MKRVATLLLALVLAQSAVFAGMDTGARRTSPASDSAAPQVAQAPEVPGIPLLTRHNLARLPAVWAAVGRMDTLLASFLPRRSASRPRVAALEWYLC